MKLVQCERIMANSYFHLLNLTHFLKISLYIRSNSPLILVTLYCMHLAHCLSRNWCMNQCNNWKNDPTKISKTRFFQYGGQTILTRSLAVIGVIRLCDANQKRITTKLTFFPRPSLAKTFLVWRLARGLGELDYDIFVRPLTVGLGRVPRYPRFGSGRSITRLQIYYLLPEC